MRRLIYSCIVLLSLSISSSPATLTGCEDKKDNVRQQIEYAREQGNNHRIAGLEKALSEINEHCNDHALQQERQQKIREKQRKVEEKEQDLVQAKKTGDPKKIAKRQEKLSEAIAELNEAKAMLAR